VSQVPRRSNQGFVNPQRVLEWAAIVAGFVTVRLLGRPAGWLGWLLVVFAGVLVATPVILAARREYGRERQANSGIELAIEYRTRLTVTLGDALTPIADLLGRINLADPGRRQALQAQLQQGVVDAAAALSGGQRTRATFFAVNGSQLVPQAWAGRAYPPPPQPLGGKDRAARLLQDLVVQHQRLLVADVGERNRPVRVDATDAYQAIILTAVYAGTVELGLLCVDNPESGSLDSADLDILGTLAQLLGAGLVSEAWQNHNGHSSPQRG
jgi:hypothetical protein